MIRNFKNNVNNQVEGREILMLSDTPNPSMLIYDCIFMGDVCYRVRRMKDDKLVAEFDKDLNLIGNIKMPVEAKVWNRTLLQLKENRELEIEMNKMFGFDKMEENFIKQGLL